jgi:hypothetical protein
VGNSIWDRMNKSRSAPAGRQGPARRDFGNMLPSDSVYLAAAMEADAVFQSNQWPVRIGAVRILEPGEIEVALVVPTDGPGTLREALDRLPGHDPVAAVLTDKMRLFRQEVHGLYFAEDQWPQEAVTPQWAYQD